MPEAWFPRRTLLDNSANKRAATIRPGTTVQVCGCMQASIRKTLLACGARATLSRCKPSASYTKLREVRSCGNPGGRHAEKMSGSCRAQYQDASCPHTKMRPVHTCGISHWFLTIVLLRAVSLPAAVRLSGLGPYSAPPMAHLPLPPGRKGLPHRI
jgi:hypothetical protein